MIESRTKKRENTASRRKKETSLKEQNARVFDGLFNFAEEGNSLAAVNQTVIIRKREVHHGPDDNLRAV